MIRFFLIVIKFIIRKTSKIVDCGVLNYKYVLNTMNYKSAKVQLYREGDIRLLKRGSHN